MLSFFMKRPLSLNYGHAPRGLLQIAALTPAFSPGLSPGRLPLWPPVVLTNPINRSLEVFGQKQDDRGFCCFFSLA